MPGLPASRSPDGCHCDGTIRAQCLGSFCFRVYLYELCVVLQRVCVCVSRVLCLSCHLLSFVVSSAAFQSLRSAALVFSCTEPLALSRSPAVALAVPLAVTFAFTLACFRDGWLNFSRKTRDFYFQLHPTTRTTIASSGAPCDLITYLATTSCLAEGTLGQQLNLKARVSIRHPSRILGIQMTGA